MKVGIAFFAMPIILVTAVLLPSFAYAFPGDEFYVRDADIYDNWGISRTRHKRADGFLGRTSAELNPMVVQESLGENVDLAWQLGEGFALKYPDRNQRAEQIFHFVRDRVIYTTDNDQFGMDEFAQNADEVAGTIVENGVARGDCEDMGVLLAVMYMAAGYRSAIVLMPGHVATLVYLPEYKKATRMINVAGESGWVWAEATMRTNSLGWVPESVANKGIIAKEVIPTELERQEVIAAELERQDDGVLATTVQTGLPRRGAGSSFVKDLVVLVAAVGLLLAIVGGGSFARRLGRRRE